MSKRKLRIVENAILVAFPVALFAGCAGSDIKPTPAEKPESGYSSTYSSYENPLPEAELTDISMVYTVEQNMRDTSPVETAQGVEPLGTDQEPNEPTQTISASVTQTPDATIFYFGTDKYQLHEEQRQTLKQHADYLLANPSMTMVINGHADVRGTERYNQSLSEQRARAIYELMLEMGVAEGQLVNKGFGETRPLHDENNWDENRRVELEFQDPVMLTGM